MGKQKKMLPAAEVWRRSGLELPEKNIGMRAEDAQDVLAAYLRQGLVPKSRSVRTQFVPEADCIAAGVGRTQMESLIDSLIPAGTLTLETALEHPEWIVAIGRFGSQSRVHQILSVNSRGLCGRENGGSRLNSAVRDGSLLSPYYEAAFRHTGKVRPEYVVRRILHSPYQSCIPDGALVGPDGTGTLLCRKVCYGLSLTPEMLLRYTDPGTGKASASAPEPLRGYWRSQDMERLHNKILRMKRYLMAVREFLQNMLDEMYLLDKAVPAALFKRIFDDPLLRQYCYFLIFRQAGTDFMLTPDGLILADGSAFSLGAEEVTVPHPVQMAADILQMFRSVPPKKANPKLPQLQEPVYRIADVTGLPNAVLRDLELRQLPGKPPQFRFREAYLPGTFRPSKEGRIREALETSWFLVTRNKWYETEFVEGNPFANHLAYLLDLQAYPERIRKDDPGVVPFLLLHQPEKHLKEAIDAKAAGITAALLGAVEGSAKRRGASAEFHL